MYFCYAFCGKLIPPRARYVILLGHAQDRQLHISETTSDHGQLSKNNVLYLKKNSLTNFSVYVIFFCADSRRQVLGRGCDEAEINEEKWFSLQEGVLKLVQRANSLRAENCYGYSKILLRVLRSTCS